MTTIATPAGVRDEHVAVPMDKTHRDVARLSFDNGLGRLDLRADAAMSDLLEVRFAEPLPVVWVNGHNVHVEYPLGARLLRRMRPNAMRINPAVPWAIDVHGGVEHLDVDLTGVDVHSIAFHSGAAHVRLTLGHPTGTRAIRLESIKDVRIVRPTGVPVRVQIAKGARNVALDSRRFGAINGLTDHTSGYETAVDRYLLILSGAADTLTTTSA